MENQKTKDVKSEFLEKLIKKIDSAPIQADLYTLEQLKIALDDLLVFYCKERGFKEKHRLNDFLNVIGLISTVLASIVLYLSLYSTFEASKKVLFICLVIYVFLSLLSFIVYCFCGGRIQFQEFDIVTRADKTPVYVSLLYWKGKVVPVKYYKSILELFDETGKLDHVLFLNDLEKLFKE
ncbi:hypothetical protein GINT2_000772 [Glugoides intestinalis]